MQSTQELATEIGVKPACDAIGMSRATLYRHLKPKQELPKPRPAPPRSLSPQERRRVLELLHTDPFVDMAPRPIHAKLLEEGTYMCSPRTMYRLLAQQDESKERRQPATRREFARPELLATRPNEVWTWDVTWLRGSQKGERYALYVMLDLFSRYVVGWMLAHTENGELAADFIRQCLEHQEIQPGELTVHSDRGSAQKSEKVVKLTDKFQVSRSYGRPRVCNDNPFSEAVNKTTKYHIDYPDRFAGYDDAKAWCRRFFKWYNHEHRHSGIAMLPPAIVHAGKHEPMIARRQATLDAAFAAHPERFVKGKPIAARLPDAVYLNKPEEKIEPLAHHS